MNTCSCPIEYISEMRGGLRYCNHCRTVVDIDVAEKKKYRPPSELILPPPSVPLTEKMWNIVSPWPNIQFDIAKKYQFYLSTNVCSSPITHIVMPIFRGGVPVFWQARLSKVWSGKNVHKKYCSSIGFKKQYWLSSESVKQQDQQSQYEAVKQNDKTKNKNDVVFIAEGIADAAHLSSIGDAVALLGLSYDGSLNGGISAIPQTKKVVIFFDGDEVGKFNSFKVASKFGSHNTTIIFGDENKDPTDYTVDELRELCLKYGI